MTAAVIVTADTKLCDALEALDGLGLVRYLALVQANRASAADSPTTGEWADLVLRFPGESGTVAVEPFTIGSLVDRLGEGQSECEVWVVHDGDEAGAELLELSRTIAESIAAGLPSQELAVRRYNVISPVSLTAEMVVHARDRLDAVDLLLVPEDRADPDSVAVPLDTPGLPGYRAVQVASLSGLWRGSGSSPASERSPSESVHIARGFARIQIAEDFRPGLVDRVSAIPPTDALPDDVGIVSGDAVEPFKQRAERVIQRKFQLGVLPLEVAETEAFAGGVGAVLRYMLGRLSQLVVRNTIGRVRGWFARWRERTEDALTGAIGGPLLQVRLGHGEITEIRRDEAPPDEDFTAITDALIDEIAAKPQRPDLSVPLAQLARVLSGLLDGSLHADPDDDDLFARGISDRVFSRPDDLARDPLRWLEGPDGRRSEAHRTDRELWLGRAVGPLLELIQQCTGMSTTEVHVSVLVDVPEAAHRRPESSVVGLCHSVWSADAGARSLIVIHPNQDDPVQALATLAHELLHALLPAAGHGSEFAEAAVAIGLDGEPESTVPGQAFRASCDGILKELGEMPPDVAPLAERLHLHVAREAVSAWQGLVDATAQYRAIKAGEGQDEASGPSDPGDSRPRRRLLRWLKRMWKWLLALVLVVVLAFSAVWLAVLLPIAMLLGTTWLGAALVGIFRTAREQYQQELALRGQDPERLASDRLGHFVDESYRLRKLSVGLDVMSRATGLVAHHPSGALIARGDSIDVEGRAALVTGPRSTRVDIVSPDPSTLEDLAQSSHRAVFEVGWMAERLEDLRMLFGKQVDHEIDLFAGSTGHDRKTPSIQYSFLESDAVAGYLLSRIEAKALDHGLDAAVEAALYVDQDGQPAGELDVDLLTSPDKATPHRFIWASEPGAGLQTVPRGSVLYVPQDRRDAGGDAAEIRTVHSPASVDGVWSRVTARIDWWSVDDSMLRFGSDAPVESDQAGIADDPDDPFEVPEIQ